MSKIFDNDSDSEVDIKTDNEYAKNYDIWRKKEEFNKFKTKYGEELLDNASSSSSEDDDEGVELTEEVEKQFFKTLSCLKNKDPRIYDENVIFFNESTGTQKNKNKTKKEKPLYINDYERELILKGNHELSDCEESEDPRAKSPTYVEEQKRLKESFKKALDEVPEDESDGEWGGMLKVRQKTEEEKLKEEEEYREWLAGQKQEINDTEMETELKPLKEYWNNPNLDDGEKFLRDYILQKKYLSKEDDDYIPTYEEIIHDSDQDLSEDENQIEKQEEFEHKYNFRFEEPDQEFIKRYPRTIEQSLRKTDDKRKLKRAETKIRKQKEKEQKMQELKKLQELKRKEIEEKIQKLKEITGNDDINFNDEDLEGDFDPEAHDRKMQSLFSEEFYEGEEGDQKPVFPELDDYLEIENWDKYNGENCEETEGNDEYAPHCEDEDFNMDCDYDPNSEIRKELIENSKGRKKRKRKSLFAKAVSEPKPVFDPNDKTYEEYLDEYYKLDCEDIIADIPCRFKYRKVIPNDYGLSVEEILMANDRELNKWCSLKKALQHRPDHIEKYDQIAYAKKAQNLALKKKILPSLFEEKKNEEEKQEEGNTKKKKMKKVRCKKGSSEENEGTEDKAENVNLEENKNIQISTENPESPPKQKKKKLLQAVEKAEERVTNVEEKPVAAEMKKKKRKKKNKKAKDNTNSKTTENGQNQTMVLNGNSKNDKPNKKRKFPNNSRTEVVPNKKTKQDFKNKNKGTGISDARLSAYGINPKKFKNKIKYGKV